LIAAGINDANFVVINTSQDDKIETLIKILEASSVDFSALKKVIFSIPTEQDAIAPKVSIKKNSNDSSEIECLLNHMRNALAHGNTLFPTDELYVLLEDKSSKRDNPDKATTRILLRTRTLIDWIQIIDKNYPLPNKQIEEGQL
jgi:hypothetical protein